MKRPELGDLRYFVEYLDYAQGIAIMKASGGDPDKDGLWDYCNENDITVRSIYFPSKWRAVEWARRNKKRDVFHMPRIIEQTYDVYPPFWVQSGYWEMDGRTEIEEARQ